MRNGYLAAALLAAASITAISCEQPTANNANRPANTANAAAPAQTTAAAEAELRKLMDTAAAALARNDADAMDKIYSENYMLVNVDGSVQNRAERLAALRSGSAKYEEFRYDEANFRFNPEVNGAVVIARGTVKGTNAGQRLDGQFRITQVYSKINGTWKQVTAQATQITGSTAPGTAANTTNANSTMTSNSNAAAPATNSNSNR